MIFMKPNNNIKRMQAFYQDEMRDYMLYNAMAAKMKNKEVANEVANIAQMEKKHAEFWQDMLQNEWANIPNTVSKGLTFHIHMFLAKLVSPMLLISLREMAEKGAIKEYYAFFQDCPINDPQCQKRLKGIIVDELHHETFFKTQFSKLSTGNIRDFVLWMNDGLVELLGAVTGLTAVYVTRPDLVGLSGLIVGVAGALSMGIGAFVSVRGQRQVAHAQSQSNHVLLTVAPDMAESKLQEHLIESGLDDKTASKAVQGLKDQNVDAKSFLTKNSEHEDENELISGLFTGFAYVIGVVFPVSPYFIFENSFVALGFSVLFAGIALAVSGGVIALLSGISLQRKISEMVIAGFIAAALSYGFGHLLQGAFGV